MLCHWEVSTVTSSLIVFAIVTITILSIQKWLKTINATSVAHLPGPRGLPILGNTLLLANKPDLIRTLIKEAEGYEGLFKLEVLFHAPMVILTAPEYFNTFYTSTDLLDRSSFYKGIDDIVPNTFFTANGARWKELRRLAIINFFNVPTTTWLTNFSINSKSLVEDLRRKSDGPFFPAADFFHHRSFDSIIANCLGDKTEEDEGKFWVHCGNEIFSTLYHRFVQPRLFFNFTSQGRKFWEHGEIVNNAAKKYIVKKWNDFLELKKKQEPLPNLYVFNTMEKLSQDMENSESLQMIIEEMKILVQAGQETSSSAMGFVLTILGILPEVQQKVYEEDQEVQRRLKGREPDPNDLKQYEYLERVIKETLRLFPIAPYQGRSVNKDTYFGTHMVPKGAEVITLLMSCHRNPAVFSDPLKFDPDRFLPENAKKVPPFAYVPFSAGPRNCPGQRYAMMSLKIYLSALVREFRIYSIYTTIEEAVENSYSKFTMLDKNQWTLRLETRKMSDKTL